ncbi:MAG: Asp23/Gls24 family envelope stress response protein [Clostridiaceae bacterium]|nr:Asp23/Gls24 family envelope stress response protein [Clostridiaceae bacterium]
MEDNQVMQNNEEMGSIKIADEVVAIIAGIEAANIKGVAGMSSGIAGGLADMLGRKNLAKGIKVDIKEQEAIIDLFITVEYGCRIPEVAWEVQEKVKSAVETMTGLKVSKVNIHVQGVNTEKDTKKQDASPKKEETKK